LLFALPATAKRFHPPQPAARLSRFKFEDGLVRASKIFGYQLYLPLEEYRSLYSSGRISRSALEQVVLEKHPGTRFEDWQDKLFADSTKQAFTFESDHYAPTGSVSIKLTLIRKHIQPCFVFYPVIWIRGSLPGGFR
jgi:hypothetical protein